MATAPKPIPQSEEVPPPPENSGLPAEATDTPPQPMRTPMDDPAHPLHHLRNCF